MPTHPMVPQDMMPMHMNMSPGMAQPHHMLAPGMPHMGMPPNPRHHEHIPQSSMYNNSDASYHHHMQSLGCPPQQHVPQQPPPQQLQQLPVQQPIIPCTNTPNNPDSQIVSNSVPYSEPIMPPVHLEQPIQMSPEQQPQQQQHPPPQQPQLEELQQQQIQEPQILPQSPVESESPSRAESPLVEQINQSPPPPESEVLSPQAPLEEKKDSDPDIQSPIGSPIVEKPVVVNDNTSVISHQSRSLSPAELNEPQSLERDCWSGSEHDPPPPTLTAEVSPQTSPKAENEITESSIFNFTEDEEPPPPLHSLSDGSPRKLKGLPKYLI